MHNDVLFSIKTKYALAIFSGYKKFELRRQRPKINCPMVCFFYETSPVSLVTGYATITEIIERPISSLLLLINKSDPFKDDYAAYLSGARCPGAIRLVNPIRLKKGIPLEKAFPKLSRPPQSYCYVQKQNVI